MGIANKALSTKFLKIIIRTNHGQIAIVKFLIGKPMYFMELVIGQYSGLGPTGVWRMNPSAKGK
jgi:hypothetical protein